VKDQRNLHELESFSRSELSRQENREVVLRLLENASRDGVAAPDAAPKAWGRERGEAPAAGRYDQAFQKIAQTLESAQGRVTRERNAAPGQWAFLEIHPQPRRLIMVRNDRRLQSWGLYDLLLSRSMEIAERVPAEALELADLALNVAGCLDPEHYGTERLADFRAAALASLGNARRLAGDLVGSRMAFQQARLSLAFGTGDLLEEANLSSLLAHLLCDLGEYETASRALNRAAALYRRAGDVRVPDLELPQSVRELEQRKGAGRA
jgi:hypothetical protein